MNHMPDYWLLGNQETSTSKSFSNMRCVRCVWTWWLESELGWIFLTFKIFYCDLSLVMRKTSLLWVSSIQIWGEQYDSLLPCLEYDEKWSHEPPIWSVPGQLNNRVSTPDIDWFESETKPWTWWNKKPQSLILLSGVHWPNPVPWEQLLAIH